MCACCQSGLGYEDKSQNHSGLFEGEFCLGPVPRCPSQGQEKREPGLSGLEEAHIGVVTGA